MYLEPQNDGPYKAEVEPWVAVDDVVRAHVLEVHPLLAEELQRLVDVLETVDAHLAFRRPRLQGSETALRERGWKILITPAFMNTLVVFELSRLLLPFLSTLKF